MSKQASVAPAKQKLVRYPLVEAGRYESIYEAAYRDLEADGGSVTATGFEAKIFSLEDLSISSVGLLKKFLQRLKLMRPVYAGDVIEAIRNKIRAEGWQPATLAHLVAYEAQHLDKHEYPLFATGLFYSHGWKGGEIGRIGLSTTVIPCIVKTEAGGRRLDQYVVGGSFEGVREPDDLLLRGYFLGVR